MYSLLELAMWGKKSHTWKRLQDWWCEKPKGGRTYINLT
jgi:hypothetical protein